MSRTTVGLVGLGYWGPNLARNFDILSELAWVCDVSDEQRAVFSSRYPRARTTADFAELLADPDLEAVVIATPVPTHYALAKQALEAGKHVLVELGNPGIVVGDLRTGSSQELDQLDGGRLAHVGDVRLVRDAEDEDARVL